MAPNNANCVGETLEDVYAVIRSLVIIKKQWTTLKEINSEYMNMEGQNIPFSDYGFNNPYDMLHRSGQFNLTRQPNGQVLISAKLSKKDEHMAKLVQETTTKKKAPFKRNFPPRKPLSRQPFSRSMQNLTGSWQKTRSVQNLAASDVMPKAPLMRNQNRQFQSNWNLQHCNKPSTASNQYHCPPPPLPQRYYNAPPPPRMPQQTRAPPPPPTFDWVPLAKEKMGRHPIVQPDIQLNIKSVVAKPIVPAPAVSLTRRPVEAPRPVPVIDPAVNFVFNQYICGQSPEVREPVRRRIPLEMSSVTTPTKQQANLHRVPAVVSPFKEVTVTRPNSLQNRLQVRPTDSRVSGAKSEALSADSGVSIGSRATSLLSLVESTVDHSSNNLASRLHDLLLHYPHGVMERSLPAVFKEATGTSLPDHWISVVATYSKYFTIDSGPIAHVVYANALGEDESCISDESQETLKFQWTSPHWNLYVTHVISTTMVWARVIGAAHSARWDSLMTEIESSMESPQNRQPTNEMMVPKVYLVKRDSFWYRVRCQEVDTEGEHFLGFYIDQGNEEWLSIDSAFVCDDKYQVLPGQAALFTLLGLEAMEENPNAKPVLLRRLQDKAVVAEIRTSEEEYKLEHGSRIKAVFFDTSTAEDINLAEELYNEICLAGKEPRLKSTGLNPVQIQHISNRGEVFVQMPDTGMEYVQLLIEKLVKNKEVMAHHKGLNEDEAATDELLNRYLVFDRVASKWHRAVLQVRRPQSTEHLMFCLDTGRELNVKEDDIRQLGPMSMALSRYPALAIRCTLFNIPKLEARVVSRIKGLLEPQSVAIARVILIPALDHIPQINVYQRLEVDKNRVIVCINDTLRMENDLESIFAGL